MSVLYKINFNEEGAEEKFRRIYPNMRLVLLISLSMCKDQESVEVM